MSTELIGNCGYTDGERGYFERIIKPLAYQRLLIFLWAMIIIMALKIFVINFLQ